MRQGRGGSTSAGAASRFVFPAARPRQRDSEPRFKLAPKLLSRSPVVCVAPKPVGRLSVEVNVKHDRLSRSPLEKAVQFNVDLAKLAPTTAFVLPLFVADSANISQPRP
jgi:hypothetical protein